MLLLDTCTFLWAATGDASVPVRVKDRLRDPDEVVLLSVVSSWEIFVELALGEPLARRATHPGGPLKRRGGGPRACA